VLEKIIGNRGPVASLQAALEEGRLPHSILILGEKGCGTGFAARCLAADLLYPQGGRMAQALVEGQTSQAVTEKDGDGRVLTGQIREVITARGDGAGGEIRAGAIRALRAEMFNTALTGEGRAAIFYGAQNMTRAGANALLKILEEPPENVHFILTANSAAAVLPTIRSRCAQYTFSPVSEEECEEYLRRHCPSCSQPALLAAAFGGCIGRALRAGQEGPEAQCFEAARKMVRALAAGREYDLLVLLAGFEKDRPVAQQLLDTFICLCDGALTHGGLEGLSPEEAARAIPLAGGALKALGGYVNTKLVLQNLGAALAGSAG